MNVGDSLDLPDKKNFAFKIIVIGNQAVGKTSLVRRFVNNKFDKFIKHSISDNYFKNDIDFSTKNSVQLQIWDFGGQAKHRHLLRNLLSGARGALILIDMTHPIKIIEILGWVNMVRQADMSLPIILVGMKSDLIENIKVKKEEIEHVINVININKYIETSSKDNINIFRVFYTVSKEIIKLQEK